MIGFVLRRVAGLAATLFFASLAVFFMLDARPESAPFWQRFFGWIGDGVRGDFGISEGGPVGELIAERLAVTLPLALLALLIAVALGVPLGMLAGAARGRARHAIVALALVAARAVPAFWLGMLLVLLVSGVLRWLPAGGFVPWARDPLGALGSLLLPAVALAAAPAARLASAAGEATAQMLASGFLRTARLKGMTLGQAVLRHGLRNAALPLIALIGPLFAGLLAGALVIENVFYLPGLGRTIFTASTQGDMAVLRAGVLAFLAAVATGLIVTDLLRLLADPRLRQEALR